MLHEKFVFLWNDTFSIIWTSKSNYISFKTNNSNISTHHKIQTLKDWLSNKTRWRWRLEPLLSLIFYSKTVFVFIKYRAMMKFLNDFQNLQLQHAQKIYIFEASFKILTIVIYLIFKRLQYPLSDGQRTEMTGLTHSSSYYLIWLYLVRQ